MAEQSWTDDPILSNASMKYKTIHFTELQDAINAWAMAYGIDVLEGFPVNWTDSPTVRGKINTTAMTEMQNALDDLWNLATGEANFSWTERPIIRTKIKAIHVNETRDNMNIMQDDYCYLCDSCDTYVACTLCNTGCHNDDCDQCDNSAYIDYKGGCLWCNFTCYQDSCDLCNNQCYPNTCTQCHGEAYRYPWT